MTLLAVARVVAWWCFWHPVAPREPESLHSFRVIETPDLHLGIRPALANEGFGVTVQLSRQ